MKIAINIIWILLLISCEDKHTKDKIYGNKNIEKKESNKKNNVVKIATEENILDEDSNNFSYQFPVFYYNVNYSFSDSINKLKFQVSINDQIKFKISRNFKIANHTWPKSEKNFLNAKSFLAKSDMSNLERKGLYSNIYEIIKIEIKTSNGYQPFFQFNNFFQSMYAYDDHQEFLIKIKPVQVIFNKLKRIAVRIVLKSPPGKKINREHTFDYVLIDTDWKLVARTYIDRVDAFYRNNEEPELFIWNYSRPIDKIQWDFLELE